MPNIFVSFYHSVVSGVPVGPRLSYLNGGRLQFYSDWGRAGGEGIMPRRPTQPVITHVYCVVCIVHNAPLP
jgi:hypothetical protein